MAGRFVRPLSLSRCHCNGGGLFLQGSVRCISFISMMNVSLYLVLILLPSFFFFSSLVRIDESVRIPSPFPMVGGIIRPSAHVHDTHCLTLCASGPCDGWEASDLYGPMSLINGYILRGSSSLFALRFLFFEADRT